MLDIRYILDNVEAVRGRLARRGAEAAARLDEVVALGGERGALIPLLDGKRGELKRGSEEFGRLQKSLAKEEADARRAGLKVTSGEIKELEARLAEIEQKLGALMLLVPNLPSDQVPAGADADSSRVESVRGEPPVLDFAPRPHWELGEKLGIIDFERAAKISGARFAVLRGAGALLERALISFMLETHTREHGYTEVMPPFLVNRDSMTGTGQLPKFEEDSFRVEGRDLFLVPTAEVPVTNLHRDEILDEEALPLRYCSWTACFRSEAGAYGRDVRGLIRQHQFNKVELVKFTRPEESYRELDMMMEDASRILGKLGLHHRVVTLSAGDMGFSAAKCYDIEVWLPSQGQFREISSCSNCEDFQARRARIRFKPAGGGRTRLVHTLNGSGLAVGRTMIAILEQCQQADGSVRVPAPLRPFMGGMERIG